MSRRFGLVLATVASVGILAGGLAANAAAVVSLNPFCSSLVQEVTGDKLRLLQEKCEWERPSGTAKPEPYTPPNVVVEPKLLTGILDKGFHQTWQRGRFEIRNAWANGHFVLYAGALASDPTQGVIVVTTVAARDKPVAVHETPSKNGALRFTAENGNILSLASESGVEYHFDVMQQKLDETR